jgi:hypothetical protein
MSGAEARLQQNSLRKASLHRARLRKASPEGKTSSGLELGFLTFCITPFLTVMPAEAGIQSGGSGGCSPRPPPLQGRREGRGRHRSGYFMAPPVMKIANLTDSGRRGVP